MLISASVSELLEAEIKTEITFHKIRVMKASHRTVAQTILQK